MLFIGGILVFFISNKLNLFGYFRYFILLIPPILLGLFYIRGRQIFEYDSDGEALNFKNRSIVPFIGKTVSDEFPKYKLKKYEVVNGIFFKRLFITISSKKSNFIMLKYDISYLSNKEIKDLKYSLNKVIKANSEQNI